MKTIFSRMETINSKQTQNGVDFLSISCRLHVRKEPQNDPKITKMSEVLQFLKFLTQLFLENLKIFQIRTLERFLNF